MPSFDAYEANLDFRLAELRQGDPAYEAHGDAILETLPYEPSDSPETDHQRILDVGCGLGFLTVKLSLLPNSNVVGIDPSEKAIGLAISEHRATPNVRFYHASAEEFAAGMESLGERQFNRAIVNMVLHAVDDETSHSILSAVRETLVPHGILTLIVPDESWVMQKLIEKAQSEGMDRDSGIAWVSAMMQQKVVEITPGMQGKPAHKEAITVQNRTMDDYARLIRAAGFGLDIEFKDPETMETTRTARVAYCEWDDHLNGYNLGLRDRHILMTQAR